MTDRELMQQALDALEGYARNCRCEGGGAPCDAAEALRARLSQPEQQYSEQWWKHEVSNAWAEGYEKGRLQRKWQGLTDEKLHLQAAAYATYRKNIYVEGMKQGEVDHMSEETLNGKWLAYYEGYREGYWAATDPAKLKEKNGTS